MLFIIAKYVDFGILENQNELNNTANEIKIFNTNMGIFFNV